MTPPTTAETVRGRTPSAGRANRFKADLPKSYQSREYYLSHSPADLWQALREEPSLNHFNDQEIWDLVALIWQANTTSQELSEGEALYATNCAACHGETGSGDGVSADDLDQPRTAEHEDMQSGEMTTRPADFSDSLQMLSASPAHLQGKILRGGMGTGMPYWGPIFTDEQTWAVIPYLYTFQFGLYLAWKASPNDPGCVTGYEVARATTSGGSFSTVGTVEKGVVKYNDATAEVGTQYYYKVRAMAGSDPSVYTAEASGKR